MDQMISDALQVVGIGIGGVFVVLSVLYVLVLVLRKFFPAKPGEEGNT